MSNHFWEVKKLLEMTASEWESLCDGCGKCCLTKLQDTETEKIVFTDIACDLLNEQNCRCIDYQKRSQLIPNCMTMNAKNINSYLEFLPASCSYKLLSQGRPLPDWHHLISGDRELIHKLGHSASNRVRFVCEIKNDEIEDYVVDWC